MNRGTRASEAQVIAAGDRQVARTARHRLRRALAPALVLVLASFAMPALAAGETVTVAPRAGAPEDTLSLRFVDQNLARPGAPGLGLGAMALSQFDADTRPAFFTPRFGPAGGGMRLSISGADAEAPDDGFRFSVPTIQTGHRTGFGLSGTVFDGFEVGIGAGYSRLENRFSHYLGLTDGIDVDGHIRYGAFALGAGLSHQLSQQGGEGRLAGTSLGRSFGVGLSYEFGQGLVSLSGSRGLGTNSLFIDRTDTEDSVKLAGRYAVGEKMNLRAAFSVSEKDQATEAAPLLPFDDWALLTGFEFSF